MASAQRLACSTEVRGMSAALQPCNLRSIAPMFKSARSIALHSTNTAHSRVARAQHSTLSTNAAAGQSQQSGYMYHEHLFWHCPGPWGNYKEYVQPMAYPEQAETKRRLHNLVNASGLLDALKLVKPRQATFTELCRAHTPSYVASVQNMSADDSKNVHRIGDETAFMPGGYDIAALAAGGAIEVTKAVLEGRVVNAYALTRPPGHHATSDMGGGYCIFNNVAVAALHALDEHQLDRVAIVDFDVHHGNGTQQIFEEDKRVLFMSVHQAGNYPLYSGAVTDVGHGAGVGTTLNIPLPPGSGSGAYRAVFDRVVAPALDTFKPQIILVSAGYDASYMDPLGHMMLGSEDFRYFMAVLKRHAETNSECDGRLVACHEGGYSDLYVPFCGLAVIEELAGIRTKVTDPYWEDVSNFAYQELQPHQNAVIKAAEKQLELLRAAVNGGKGSNSRHAPKSHGRASPLPDAAIGC